MSRGGGGKLAASVIIWYLITSFFAGLVGLIFSSLLFNIELFSENGNMTNEVYKMFTTLNGDSISAALPIYAILFAIITALFATKFLRLQKILNTFDYWMNNSFPYITMVMPLIVFFLGITLGVNTGATESIKNYFLMTCYTFFLCMCWLIIYQLIVIKLFAKQSIRRVMSEYFFPTAIFAAGTCSSLATLPVNLENIKKYGVNPTIAGFVIPIGAIINLDTSALAYVAYAPFIMTIVFDIPITLTALLIAWPAIVLFTVAAPGLPAGMGTALWSSTLFASLLNFDEAQTSVFITTWIALSGGLPDMLRTAINCTCDGFTAIFFNEKFAHYIEEDY
jgi:Na+/H+-dicarboxylate symporter